MGPLGRALLIGSCLANCAFCLRTDLNVRPQNSSDANATPQCVGEGAYEVVFQRDTEEDDKPPPVNPNKIFPQLASLLDGTQWCPDSSSVNSGIIKNRVALVMIGQSFRSRNYHTSVRSSCTPGTVEAQEKLVKSHLDMVILPLEQELGMNVDVFLTDTPCGSEIEDLKNDHVLQEKEESFDKIAYLKRWYTEKRVKGVARTAITDNMHDRIRTTFELVDDHMREEGGAYEYYIVLRYDIHMDRSIMAMLSGKGDPAHKGLSFYGYAHDFLVSFPGETWSCMLKLWTQCMRGKYIAKVPEGPACSTFGPLQLDRWSYHFGYKPLFVALDHAFVRSVRPELLPERRRRWVMNGTSAFDVLGKEYRCTGGWYWPPAHSFEKNRSMPAYFHVS